MVRLRKYFIICASLFIASTLHADTIDRGDDMNENDIQALREWINTKRQVSVKELGGNLYLTGEVRTEFQSANETSNGIKQRGHNAAVPNAGQSFDVEVNLSMDYRTDKTWSSFKLRFDNAAGVQSGTFDKLKLEKAYWGVHVAEGDTYTVSIEVGRRRLNNIFDSKIEFNSIFDGALFRYDQAIENLGDVYIHIGPFVVNERIDFFAYVGEIGFLNIAHTNFYTKYSLIDWATKHHHKETDQNRFRFIVSQLLLAYRFMPRDWWKAALIYGAVLTNHAAKPLAITAHQKANWGGYFGFTIGELKKKGDWSFDANYQVVGAQALPDFDNGGIGIGNAADTGLYTNKLDGKGGPTTRKTAGGNNNYRGFALQLDYLLTSNLNFQQQWLQSITLDKSIGPFRRFKQYEIEFIYGF